MREVIIQSWCDECLAHGTNTPAEPIDITWRNRDVSLDLCDEHAAPFHEIDRMIADYGHPQKKKQRKPKNNSTAPSLIAPDAAPSSTTATSEHFLTDDGTYHCPDCERTFARAQALGSHRNRIHGYRRNR